MRPAASGASTACGNTSLYTPSCNRRHWQRNSALLHTSVSTSGIDAVKADAVAIYSSAAFPATPVEQQRDRGREASTSGRPQTDSNQWQWQQEQHQHVGSNAQGDSIDLGSESARHTHPKFITALLNHTTNLGRFERILDQHAMFLNSRHIAIALSILPGIADRSRASTAVSRPPRQDSSQESTSSSTTANMHQAGNVWHAAQHGMQDELAARARRVRVLSSTSRLAQEFLRHLPQYGTQDVANAVWAVARLKWMPTQRWMSSVLAASFRLMGQFEPQQLSCLLWGLAVLKVNPGAAWMASAQEHVMSRVRAGSMTAQGLAVSLWSIASIASSHRAAPAASAVFPREGMDSDSSRASSSSSRSSSNGNGNSGDVSRSNDGSSMLQSSWLESYLDAIQPRLSTLEPRHLAMTLSALAKFGYRPPQSFMNAMLRLTMDCMGSLGPHGVCGVLWALAQLNYRPHRDWLSRCMSEAERQLPRMCSQQKAMTLWALAMLQAEPHESLLHTFESSSISQLEDFSPQGISMTMWAMAKLGFRPGIMWMDKMAKVTQDQQSLFSHQAQSNLIWALAVLKYTPHPSWLRVFVARSVQSMPGSSAQALSNSAVALVKLGHNPGPAWVGSFLSASMQILKRQKAAAAAVEGSAAESAAARRRSQRKAQHRQQDGGQLWEEAGGGGESAAEDGSDAAATATASSSMHSGSLREGSAVTSVAEATAAAAAGFSPQELANTLWALARLRVSPSASWLACAEHVALALVPLMAAQNVSNTLYAIARMPQLRGEEVLLQAALERLTWLLRHEAQQVVSQDVANTLWALAKLGFEPGAASLACLLEAAEQLLPCSSHEEQAQIIWATCKLVPEPPPGLLHNLVQASWPMLGSMSYVSIWTLLNCMASLGYRPPQSWVEDAAAAAAQAAASPRSRALTLRQRTKMADGVLFALEELGYLPPGDEGQHMWQQQQQHDVGLGHEEWPDVHS